jgi:hypothetical protein
MKWFFLVSFVAGLIGSVFMAGLIIFVIATSRFRGMGIRGLALVASLVFLIWAAREMFRAFKGVGVDE